MLTIDATKEEGKMLLTVTSEDGSAKELYEALSGVNLFRCPPTA